MAYAPTAVQGSSVKFKQASGITAYTVIPGVTDASESGEDADTIDVTPIDSASEVTLTGFAKPGSLALTLAVDLKNNVHQALQACAIGTGSAKLCDIQYALNDATTASTRTWTSASVSKFEMKLGAKGAQTANVTIKLSGSPTNTAGA
jgi:hypothetical protein